MNWFSWLSIGYWLGSGQQQSKGNTGTGLFSIIVFVLAVEYILPEWFSIILSPGLLIDFKPLKFIITLIVGVLYLFFCRKGNSVPARYILFYLGISNLFFALLMAVDPRF